MMRFCDSDENYKPDAGALEQLKAAKKLSITVAYSEECYKCKDTLPALKCVLKELTEAKITELSAEKDGDRLRELGIANVPAILVYKNDLEKGRIVGTPQQSFERDILAAYDSPYPFSRYIASDWYEPEAECLKQLKDCSKLKLLVFHADWCPDCTYTLPLLKKIVEALGEVPVENVIVDRYKKDAKGLAEKHSIVSIPTIIVYKNDIEKGRIVESPQETLEQDILKFYNEPFPYARYTPSDWYEPDQSYIQYLAKYSGIKVVIFHADWCPDCTYTLPLCKKIFDALPNILVEDVIVDKQKKDAKGVTQSYNISHIPTLVVTRADVEVGRIVETPANTIETDICDFLRGVPEAEKSAKKMK